VRNMWRAAKKRCWRPSAGRRRHTLSTVRRWPRTGTVALFAVCHVARRTTKNGQGARLTPPFAVQRMVHDARWTTPFAVRRGSRRTAKVGSGTRCASPFAMRLVAGRTAKNGQCVVRRPRRTTKGLFWQPF
jgi:hypothetical protein